MLSRHDIIGLCKAGRELTAGMHVAGGVHGGALLLTGQIV